MPVHHFTLIVDGSDLQDGAIIDRLFEAGCDDAAIGRIGEVQYADFNREAASIEEAVLSAVADVAHVEGINAVRVAGAGLVSMTDIADRTGCTHKMFRPYADRESIKQEIHDLIKEAGTENWDGEGALALDVKTVEIAQNLVDEFPGHVIRPDVAATPHGEVDFDWTVSREVMLTVSVCPSGEIAFAGLFQDTRLNGREPWMGSLPKFVGCCFERLREFQDQ